MKDSLRDGSRTVPAGRLADLGRLLPAASFAFIRCSQVVISVRAAELGLGPGSGGIMYYSAGVAGLAAFGSATAFPHDGVLWLTARLMLDGAGALFGMYLLVGIGLSLTGRVMRIRCSIANSRSRLEK